MQARVTRLGKVGNQPAWLYSVSHMDAVGNIVLTQNVSNNIVVPVSISSSGMFFIKLVDPQTGETLYTTKLPVTK